MDRNSIRGSSACRRNLACQDERKFPTNTPCWVTIQWVEDNQSIWVLQNAEIDTMEHVSQYLADTMSPNHIRVSSVKINDVVSALDTSDECWYRAKILSTEPMTIQFIDFGNVSSVSPEGVAPLPPLLSAIPPLAIRVKLQSETNICPSVGDELCVNYISSENGIAVVSTAVSPESTMTVEAVECDSGNGCVIDPDLTSRNSDDQAIAANLLVDSTVLVSELSSLHQETQVNIAVPKQIEAETSHAAANEISEPALLSSKCSDLKPTIPPNLPGDGGDANELTSDVQGQVQTGSLLDAQSEVQTGSLLDAQSEVQTGSLLDAQNSVQTGSLVDALSGIQTGSLVDAQRGITSQSTSRSHEMIETTATSASIASEPLFPKEVMYETAPAVSIVGFSDFNSGALMEVDVHSSMPTVASDTTALIEELVMDDSTTALTPLLADSILKPMEDSSLEDSPDVYTPPTGDIVPVPIPAGPIEEPSYAMLLSKSASLKHFLQTLSPDGASPGQIESAEPVDVETPHVNDIVWQEPNSEPNPEVGEPMDAMHLSNSSHLRHILPTSPEVPVNCGNGYDQISAVSVYANEIPPVLEVVTDSLVDASRERTEIIPSSNHNTGETTAIAVSVASETLSDISEEVMCEVVHEEPMEGSSECNNGVVAMAEDVCRSLPATEINSNLQYDAAETVPDLSAVIVSETICAVPDEPKVLTAPDESRSAAKTSDPSSAYLAETVSDASQYTTSETASVEVPIQTLAGTSMAVDMSSSMRRVPQSDGALNAAARVFKMSVPSSLIQGRNPRPLLPPRGWNREPSKDNPSMNMKPEFSPPTEFDLRIIQEQNRIQMLQLQQRMEQELAYQINSVKQETARQFSMIGHKLANVFADIALLKNEIALMRYPQSSVPKMSVMNSVDSRNSQLFNDKSTAGFENVYHSNGCEKNKNHHENGYPSSSTAPNHHEQLPSINQSRGPCPNVSKADFVGPSVSNGEKTGKQKENTLNNTFKTVFVNRLSEKTTIDHLVNLFGVYGNVQKIKMSPGSALIEMSNHDQASMVIHYLNNVKLMGSRLSIAPYKFEHLKLTRQDFESNLCKDLTKPGKVKLHRYYDHNKWDLSKLTPPCQSLMISNVLKSVSDDKIKELFAKEGFQIQEVVSKPAKFAADMKILFVHFDSTEAAVNALAVMHQREVADWVCMRILFAKPSNSRTPQW